MPSSRISKKDIGIFLIYLFILTRSSFSNLSFDCPSLPAFSCFGNEASFSEKLENVDIGIPSSTRSKKLSEVRGEISSKVLLTD